MIVIKARLFKIELSQHFSKDKDQDFIFRKQFFGRPFKNQDHVTFIEIKILLKLTFTDQATFIFYLFRASTFQDQDLFLIKINKKQNKNTPTSKKSRSSTFPHRFFTPGRSHFFLYQETLFTKIKTVINTPSSKRPNPTHSLT